MRKTLLGGLCLVCGLGLFAQRIQVKAPDGGEDWRIGSTETIAWTSSGLGLGLLKVTLWLGETQVGVVATNMPLQQYRMRWNVGTLLGGKTASPGAGYRIKVRVKGQPLKDFSDMPFTISRPPAQMAVKSQTRSQVMSQPGMANPGVLPDFQVYSLSIQDLTPPTDRILRNDELAFIVEIDGGDFFVGLNARGSCDGPWYKEQQQLGGGGKVIKSFKLPGNWPTDRDIKICIKVDCRNDIVESNEQNNCKCIVFRAYAE